jgi:ribosome-binding factor A
MRHFPYSKIESRTRHAEADADEEPRQRLSSRPRPRRKQGRGVGFLDRAHDRKACQLCRQVAQALEEVLADCGDGILQNLRVVSVIPFPDASRLLVTVNSIDDRPEKQCDARALLDHLQNASGHLRSEVAGAVTRRHAPLLVYQVGPTVIQ